MGLMTYSAVVLLFGVILGAVFANTVRAGIQTFKAFLSYLKSEAQAKMSEPVVEKVD
jgi:hypothetical protein